MQTSPWRSPLYSYQETTPSISWAWQLAWRCDQFMLLYLYFWTLSFKTNVGHLIFSTYLILWVLVSCAIHCFVIQILSLFQLINSNSIIEINKLCYFYLFLEHSAILWHTGGRNYWCQTNRKKQFPGSLLKPVDISGDFHYPLYDPVNIISISWRRIAIF